jgi:hypothetical protein
MYNLYKTRLQCRNIVVEEEGKVGGTEREREIKTVQWQQILSLK